MNHLPRRPATVLAIVSLCSALLSLVPGRLAAENADQPYKILATTRIPAAGGIDYVTADSPNRRVYVACGKTVSIFDLDTHKLVGSLPDAAGHGVAIDPMDHTGLVSGNPATLFNTRTLEKITSIPAPGADGFLFDAPAGHFFILSHRAPNLRVFNARDGSVVGTVEAIGPDGANAAVEQGATDGEGHLYFDIANQHHIAVVDAKTLKVTGHFDLGEKANGPAGLAIDAKNHILFAMCRGGRGGSPTCVIVNALDGKVITTLPLAGGSDGAAFNPRTMEAFSSHGNGTLTVIKENSPTDFVVEQTVQTKAGAKTCTLDEQTGHIVVITREAIPGAAASAAPAAPAPTPSAASENRGWRGERDRNTGPHNLDVIFIGR